MIIDKYIRDAVERSGRREITISMIEEAELEKEIDDCAEYMAWPRCNLCNQRLDSLDEIYAIHHEFSGRCHICESMIRMAQANQGIVYGESMVQKTVRSMNELANLHLRNSRSSPLVPVLPEQIMPLGGGWYYVK